MSKEIDAYHEFRPFDFTELVQAVVVPYEEERTGLTMRLTLATRDGSRRLSLTFAGVTGLTVEDFSGPTLSFLDVVSTRDRGWEAPRFLVSSDQGRIRFGCMAFEATPIEPSGDIAAR